MSTMYKFVLISMSVLISTSACTDFTDSESEVAEHSEGILEMDKTLCKKLTAPSFQDGMTILSELMNLHLLLTEVSHMFKGNKEVAWKIVDILDDFGGLKTLTTPINGTLIQQALRWPDDKMLEIKSSLRGISAIWRDLRRLAKEPMSDANYPKDINFQFEPK